MGAVSGASIPAIKELHKDLKKWEDSNRKLSSQMFWLTVIIAFLTLIMSIAVGFQIYLQFFNN